MRLTRGDLLFRAQVPERLWTLIQRDGISLTGAPGRDSLGQHDYTWGAGWMYDVNGYYPGKGLSEWMLGDGDVLTLPITPASYEWTTGKNIETVNISQLGDVYLPGNRSRHSGTIECLLPSQDYPFNQAGTILDPGYYLEPLRYWAAEKIPVRYIVTESDINALVYIESVTEKEQDGTGDVYCTIALREYVDLEAQEVATLNTTRYTGNSGRKSDAAKDITYHRVVSGDTLSMLCRRTYGDGTASYYNALAKYNGISNPHLIYVGQTIKLPPKDILLGGG